MVTFIGLEQYPQSAVQLFVKPTDILLRQFELTGGVVKSVPTEKSCRSSLKLFTERCEHDGRQDAPIDSSRDEPACGLVSDPESQIHEENIDEYPSQSEKWNPNGYGDGHGWLPD